MQFTNEILFIPTRRYGVMPVTAPDHLQGISGIGLGFDSGPTPSLAGDSE
jgi:hypothetical protein